MNGVSRHPCYMVTCGNDLKGGNIRSGVSQVRSRSSCSQCGGVKVFASREGGVGLLSSHVGLR